MRLRLHRRRAKTGNRRHIFGAGPCSALLSAATQQGLLHMRAGIGKYQCPGSFRAAELVGRYYQHVGTKLRCIAACFASGLHGVADQNAASRMYQLRRCGHRLQHAGFIVGGLQGQHRALPLAAFQNVAKRRQVQGPIGQQRHLTHGVHRKSMPAQHAGMLARADKQQVEVVQMIGQNYIRHQRHIGGLGAARREHDLRGRYACQPCDLRPCRLDRRAGALSLAMDRRRIAGIFHRRQHGSACARLQRRAGVEIEICPLVLHGFTKMPIIAARCRRRLRQLRQNPCIATCAAC